MKCPVQKSCHKMSCYEMSCHERSYYEMLCHEIVITNCHVMSYDVMSLVIY